MASGLNDRGLLNTIDFGHGGVEGGYVVLEDDGEGSSPWVEGGIGLPGRGHPS